MIHSLAILALSVGWSIVSLMLDNKIKRLEREIKKLKEEMENGKMHES